MENHKEPNVYKKIRFFTGLSVAKLGEFLGKSASAVSHYENYKRTPRDGEVIKKYMQLAKKAGIKITADMFFKEKQ